ncbi:MAG: hypothetical protein ACK4I8_06765 [Armatimonadota bacterium]
MRTWIEKNGTGDAGRGTGKFGRSANRQVGKSAGREVVKLANW